MEIRFWPNLSFGQLRWLVKRQGKTRRAGHGILDQRGYWARRLVLDARPLCKSRVWQEVMAGELHTTPNMRPGEAHGVSVRRHAQCVQQTSCEVSAGSPTCAARALSPTRACQPCQSNVFYILGNF